MLVAESTEHIKQSINLMSVYCELCKLNINVSKVEITLLSRIKTRKKIAKTQFKKKDEYEYQGIFPITTVNVITRWLMTGTSLSIVRLQALFTGRWSANQSFPKNHAYHFLTDTHILPTWLPGWIGLQ